MTYEKTVPRGPIGAMMSGPGPVYKLPTLTGNQGHDPQSVYLKYPGWPFGVRHNPDLAKERSPGPAVTKPNVKVTRYGKDGTPLWSLYGRVKDPQLFQPPGPGTYHPEAAGPSAAPASPRYSFGYRTKLRNTDRGPAPNTYSLPALMGKTVEGGKKQAPIWTQLGRSKYGGFDQDLSRAPGPGTHPTTNPSVYRRKAPSYSLGPRVEMPGDTTKKPGPGQHFPENVKIHQRSAPAPSFGIRHSDYLCPLIVDHGDD